MAWFLALALLLAALSGVAAAEGFGAPPTARVALGVGETLEIDVSTLLTPEGKTLQYKSSDGKVASVSEAGVVTALKKGSATIAIGYDQTLAALCKVSVLAAPDRIALSPKAAVLSVGDTKNLKAALPGGTASVVAYSSSNEAVATVDDAGRVTAVSGGRAVITGRTFNGKTAECAVYVLNGKAPSTLSLNVSSVALQVGETFRVVPSVDEGSDAVYRFVSKDKRVATVDADGLITGVRKGSTVVGVATHNGLTQKVAVTVKAALLDVYGALTDDPRTFIRYAGKLKLTQDADASDNATAVFSNEEMALAMTAHSCSVSLRAGSSPRYSIHGIDVSMSPESAAAKLIAAGWAMTGSKSSDGVQQKAFTLNGDDSRVIAIATADGIAIQGLRAQWSW